MSDDRDLIYQGKLLRLYRERVSFPNGGHGYFDIIKHPGASVIAASNQHGEYCLLKQWRHAVQQHIWEFPAGCLEPDETPLNSAKRELEEETGVIAEQWRELGVVYPSPGFSDEVLHFFHATELSEGVVNLDEAEQLEAHWLPLKRIQEMAKSGEISDAKTLALLYLL